MSLVWYTLAALPILAYLFRRPILRLLTPKGIPDIPAYDDPQPIWGDINRFKLALERDGGFSKCFDQIATDLGVISQLRLGFFSNFIVLADYTTIEHVLLKQHATIDRAKQTTDVFQGLVPTGQIALPTNDMWKHHRRIVGPAMTSKYLSLATPLANIAVQEFVAYLRTKTQVAGDRSYEIEKDMEAATMDAICSMAFGSSWGCARHYETQLKEKNQATTGPLGQAVFKLHPPDLHESMIYLFESVDNYSALPKFSHFFTKLKPTYRKHSRRLHAYLDDKLESARKRATSLGPEAAVELADNTLDMMVARELKGEDWMSEAEMKDELYLYLIAGTETSATTLSWWTKYMTNHPDIQRKLRAHLLDRIPAIQDRPPTYDEVSPTNVPYLEAVVHETLRLSRTAGAYAREALEDVIILGKRIPKGTTIIMPTVTGWEDRSTPVYTVPSSMSSASTTSSGATSSSGSSVELDEQASDDDRAVKVSASLDHARAEGDTRKVGYWEGGTGKLFQPERWLDAEGNFTTNAGPSLPFSIGRRSCAGRNLALLELRLFMAQLNYAFFFERVPEEQNSFEKFETITSHPRQSFVRPVSWKE